MRFTRSLWFAGISAALLLLLAASATSATKRPRYGGTLRVELLASSASLDPREWKSGSLSAREDEKLAALVYDRLVTLDDYGRFQPALAIEWSHDAAARNWQFKLRPGVMFSDGSLLTSADVVASLQSLLPAGLQLTATDTAISIHSPPPATLCFARCPTTRFSARALSTSPKSAPPLPTRPIRSPQSPRA